MAGYSTETGDNLKPHEFDLTDGRQALRESLNFTDSITNALNTISSPKEKKENLAFIQAQVASQQIGEVAAALSNLSETPKGQFTSAHISENHQRPNPGEEHGRRIRLTGTDDRGHTLTLSIDMNSARRAASSVDIKPSRRARQRGSTPSELATEELADGHGVEIKITTTKRKGHKQTQTGLTLIVSPQQNALTIKDFLTKQQANDVTITTSNRPGDPVKNIIDQITDAHKTFYDHHQSKLRAI